MIKYIDRTDMLKPHQLRNFFQNWTSPPNPEIHLKILQNSYKCWLAFDENKCVGFINAISDHVFYSFIPLLEVLPEYQGKGIGTKLVKLMLESLRDMYAVDLICEENLVGFYSKFEFERCVGLVKRNFTWNK